MLGTRGLKPVDFESQETGINIYKIEDHANIYTCEPKMLEYMEKLREQHPDEVKLAKSDGYANTYHVPKKWIKVQAPFKRQLTPEQRKELSDRMKSLIASKQAT